MAVHGCLGGKQEDVGSVKEGGALKQTNGKLLLNAPSGSYFKMFITLDT